MTRSRTLRQSWIMYLLCLALLVGIIPSQTSDAQTTSAQHIKMLVQNTNPHHVQQLTRAGGQQLASYDSFSVWSIPSSQRSRLAADPAITFRDTYDTIYLRDLTLDTSQPIEKPALAQASTSGQQLWMIQFVGPTKDSWLAELRNLGLEPVITMPSNGYVVRGDLKASQQLTNTMNAGKSPVQWMSAYHPWYRLSPSLRELALNPQQASKNTMIDITVQLVEQSTTAQDLQQLIKLANNIYKAPSSVIGLTSISVQVPQTTLANIANWPMVYNIETWGAPELLDEVQGQILANQIDDSGAFTVPTGPGYLNWLTTQGFPQDPAAYPIIDVVDDGIDKGNANAIADANLHELGNLAAPDRVMYISNCTPDLNGNAVGGHGHLNIGIVGGYNDQTSQPHQDNNGYNRGVGISPYTRLAGTKIFANTGGYDISQCGSTDAGVVESSYQAGATITSNSWGCGPPLCGSGNIYDAASQAYDALTRDASAVTTGNQEMLHVFSAGNSSNSGLGTPGTAKNVLTVGATENVRDEGVNDGCNIPNADNADDIATFSSIGPVSDGRAKPDITAPGTHIQSAASPDPGFDGSGVCGNSGSDNRYYPLGQTLYTWSSGTSHSAPAVAGATSLVYEYYGRVLKPGFVPSPAMLKALIVNTPRYLNGVGTGGSYPTSTQGWGNVNLETIFDGTSRTLLDQLVTFANSGETYTRTIEIADALKPVHVSLVWTDAPGSTTGASYVNNLNLTVQTADDTYYGNVFVDNFSIVGGTADQANNIENIFLPAGTTGPITVTVIAENIAGDGIPGNADLTDQDFALIAYNTLDNNPALPDASFTTASESIVEAATTINVTVELDRTSSEDVEISLITQGTANAGVDYILPSSTVTIPASQTSTSFSVTILDDSIYEGTEIIDIVMVGATNADVVIPSRHRIVVTDNEPAPIMTWNQAVQTVPETASSQQIQLSLNTPSSVPAKATISLTGTAEYGVDYRLASKQVLFAPGTTSVSVTVDILADQLDEFDETIVMSLTDLENVTTSAPSATVTILDDDELPMVIIGQGSAKTQTYWYTNTQGLAIPDNNAEGITTTIQINDFNGLITDLDFRINGTSCSNAPTTNSVGVAHTWVGDLRMRLSAPSGGSMLLMDRPGTGSSGSNGNNFCQTTLDDEATGISIQNIPNEGHPYTGVYTPLESLGIFNNIGTNGSWALNISDNASQDTGRLYGYSLIVSGISLASTQVMTVTEDSGTISLIMLLDNPSGRTIQVPYTVSGTANAEDHTLTSGTLELAPGQTYQYLSFDILDTPTIAEPTETLIITLQTPDYAQLSPTANSYQIRILDSLTDNVRQVYLPLVRR